MGRLETGLFRRSIGTNGTIGTNRKGCQSNGFVGEYESDFSHLNIKRLF